MGGQGNLEPDPILLTPILRGPISGPLDESLNPQYICMTASPTGMIQLPDSKSRRQIS